MLTDFQNYFSDRLNSKFAAKSSVSPPHLIHVPTLPCDLLLIMLPVQFHMVHLLSFWH